MGHRDDATRYRLRMEVIVQVTDAAALRRTALENATGLTFVGESSTDGAGDDGRSAAAAIRGSTADALAWVVDPVEAVVGIPGLDADESSHEVLGVGPDGHPMLSLPEFSQRFETCSCGFLSCERCAGWQLTSRTAMALWTSAQVLADQAYDDVESHGDEPVRDPDQWLVFGEYPPITHSEDAVWRRQAARAFDDLAEDLSEGRWPIPRCFGEEMALHLILEDARASIEDHLSGRLDELEALPSHPDDLDWAMAFEALFQDTDILTLNDPARDGIEDPDSEENRRYGIGDMRPHAWFKPFDNVPPRDGRRGFRR